MMNRTAKLRLLALIPLLLAALWYPAQKIRSYEFPAVPPQEFRFRVAGVDPYDPFRGRYITLDIKTPELETEDFTFRPYKYAVLGRDKDNFATVTELSEKNAPNRPCLRIRYHGIALSSRSPVIFSMRKTHLRRTSSCAKQNRRNSSFWSTRTAIMR